ncbi:MAG: hypothetical protein IT373_08705 [Polyangiaceae bacterium]|nr:hypothetical protein [Polyangiaceae bacterium]
MTLGGELMSPVRGVTLPFAKGKQLAEALAREGAGPEPAPASSTGEARPSEPERAPTSAPEWAAARAPASAERHAATPFVTHPEQAWDAAARSAQDAAESARPSTPFRTLLQRAVDPTTAAVVAPPPSLQPTPRPPSPPPTSATARPSAPPAELTVEQCAALFAECVTVPERRAAVWARYGLPDEHAYRALEQRWRERFGHDPALFQRWSAYYAHYCRWFATQPSGTQTGRGG